MHAPHRTSPSAAVKARSASGCRPLTLALATSALIVAIDLVSVTGKEIARLAPMHFASAIMNQPAWRKIHDHLLAGIHAGQWREGDRLPSESELRAVLAWRA